MAAKVTAPNQRVYTDIGDELALVSGIGIPGAAADMTAFRALTDMATAAFLVINVGGTDYAIPLLDVVAFSPDITCVAETSMPSPALTLEDTAPLDVVKWFVLKLAIPLFPVVAFSPDTVAFPLE